MDRPDIVEAHQESIYALVRRWGPYALTAIIVPGGIAVALLLLWRRWSQARHAAGMRAAVQDAARA